MRVLHVVVGMGKASGVTTFVENVVREERALGHEVEVVTGEQSSCVSSSAYISAFDVIHIHGLWSPLLHRASRMAAKCKVPVVWSTHGMTAPWSMRHKWWKKIFAWHLYQKRDLKAAVRIHCTTELEAKWNQGLGFSQTFVVPLGTILPRASAGGGAIGKTLLFVGRIYPVKALDNLIRAFALALRSQSSSSSWRLRLVGPDQAGHLAELKALCDELKLNQPPRTEVEFVGPKYGDDLASEYDSCTALALVSHTENFGATVVDALAHGKPVITSTNTPWSIVSERKCGWWISNDVETLAATIVRLFGLSDLCLVEMGANGRTLVEEHYTWPAVTRELMANIEM